jgi:hypothetical protein
MENWIGIGIWIVLGAAIGLLMKVLVRQEDATPGHTTVIAVLGAFGGVIGGMLGVGIFQFYSPTALSLGGMGGAVALSLLMTFLYRWGVRGWAPDPGPASWTIERRPSHPRRAPPSIIGGGSPGFEPREEIE